MSRIRSIKPEFWSSVQVSECSREARLLFIGLWNFCDDNGRMGLSARQIKMQVFPGDDDLSSTKVRGMLDELSSNGLIDIYTVEKKEYLQVTGWRHQKIDRPHKSAIPANSTNPHTEFDDRSTTARRPFVADTTDRREGGSGTTDRPTDRGRSTKLRGVVDGAASLASPLECGSLRDANPDIEKKARGHPVKAGNGTAAAGCHAPPADPVPLTEAEIAERAATLRALSAEIVGTNSLPASAKGNGSATGPPPELDEAKLVAYRDKPVQISAAAKQIFGARVPTET
jgi:hypothetical protein